MKSHWETNSGILRRHYQGLLDEICSAALPPVDMEIIFKPAASGSPTVVINGLYIHTSRDPHKEGQRIAEAAVKENPSAGMAVILGFGLGYAAQSLADVAPDLPIIIVEKNIYLMRKALELQDFSKMLLRKNIAFLPGKLGENVIGAMSIFEKNACGKSLPLIIKNRALTGINEQWYAGVENRIRSFAVRNDVNAATLKKFGRRWMKNLSRNVTAIRDIPGISALAGLAAQPYPLPVFLAAAGPGLDAVGCLLPEIAKRCITVAVDTSLRFFRSRGIDPDFALVIDPQFWNSRHLDRCQNSHTALIVETSAYPPVLRMPFKKMFMCGSLFPEGKFIEEKTDLKGLLGTGGSVATAAYEFARLLAAVEIWIAGLDLAFPGLKTHYKGALFEEMALAESNRLNPAETRHLHTLQDGHPFMASIPSGKVMSDRRLSLYAAWFENSFRQNPGIRNLGFYAGGLSLAGLEAAKEQALLSLPERRNEINTRLDTAFSRIEAAFFDAEETQRRSARFEKALSACL